MTRGAYPALKRCLPAIKLASIAAVAQGGARLSTRTVGLGVARETGAAVLGRSGCCSW